ncbi:alcohol dehydrogenase [Ancylomarina salipaludis]|uniref:Alcohol dehydrogenase n=1 Tax=Ancylomarina salipaludis TaxID=2501299 RepID=A0A4V1MZV3_9BACT|nr:PQQ-binding-like beta-propeller repeat protein [Ancylomarina salipaludis]RXQ89864.1 alcohol dehydrogenase [Ancylomarina salipaludis]
MKSLFLLIFSFLFVFQSYAQEESQWRGPNRDGKYPAKNLLKKWPATGPKLLWHYDDLGDGHASATVTDTRIYTAGVDGEQGFVIAFDYSGKQLWKTNYAKEWLENYDGVRGTPLLDHGMLYIMSGHGELVALSANSGEIIWSKNMLTEYGGRNLRFGMTENLLIEGDKIFCTPGGEEVNIIALNKKTGDLIWKTKANGETSAYCSPLFVKLANRSLMVTHTANSIVGIDTQNGEMMWRFEHKNQYSIHPNTPLYQDGMLFCFSGYGKGGVMLQLSADGRSVKEVWRNASLDSQMGGAVLLDGKIYGSGHTNRQWFCLDWKTGQEIYSSKALAKGNVIYADGMLYCYGDNGEIGLVDVKDGAFNKVSSFRVPYGSKQHWAHLVIHKNRLYVRHGNAFMVYEI